jgi:hypothetical protein
MFLLQILETLFIMEEREKKEKHLFSDEIPSWPES